MVQSYAAKSHGKAVTRYDFSSPFAEAWYATMTAKNIQAGFKISGVFPFNKHEHPFELPTEKYRSFNPEEVVKKSKLKYIPLYSPTPCRRRHNQMIVIYQMKQQSRIHVHRPVGEDPIQSHRYM